MQLNYVSQILPKGLMSMFVAFSDLSMLSVLQEQTGLTRFLDMRLEESFQKLMILWKRHKFSIKTPPTLSFKIDAASHYLPLSHKIFMFFSWLIKMHDSCLSLFKRRLIIQLWRCLQYLNLLIAFFCAPQQLISCSEALVCFFNSNPLSKHVS